MNAEGEGHRETTRDHGVRRPPEDERRLSGDEATEHTPIWLGRLLAISSFLRRPFHRRGCHSSRGQQRPKFPAKTVPLNRMRVAEIAGVRPSIVCRCRLLHR